MNGGVFGDQVRGHKVFDSPDHRLTFIASRLHNFYSWLVILPLTGYLMIYSSIQLRRTLATAVQYRLLRYDLLNPDQRGGFLFVERAHVAFNLVAAIVYVQITAHIGTFDRMNSEHVISYVFATLMLIGINRIFLGEIYSTIRELRLEALNSLKDKVLYASDPFSLEILKYCYERKVNAFAVLNFAIKATALLVSVATKISPLLSKTFSGP